MDCTGGRVGSPALLGKVEGESDDTVATVGTSVANSWLGVGVFGDEVGAKVASLVIGDGVTPTAGPLVAA